MQYRHLWAAANVIKEANYSLEVKTVPRGDGTGPPRSVGPNTGRGAGKVGGNQPRAGPTLDYIAPSVD